MPTEEHILPKGSAIFLIVVGLLADSAQAFFLWFFGIGLVLNPFVVTPVTWLIFYVVLKHHDISLTKSWRGMTWVAAIATELIPLIDVVPGWLVFALVITVFPPRE